MSLSGYQNEGNAETFIVKGTVIGEGHMFQPDGTFAADGVTPNAVIIPVGGPVASQPIFVATAPEGATHAVGDPVTGINIRAYTSYKVVAGAAITAPTDAADSIMCHSDTVPGCVELDSTTTLAAVGVNRTSSAKAAGEFLTIWPL